MRIGLPNCRCFTMDTVCYKLLLLFMNARCTDMLVNIIFSRLSLLFFQIISIGLRTWVRPVYRAPNAVIKAQDSFVIRFVNMFMYSCKCL